MLQHKTTQSYFGMVVKPICRLMVIPVVLLSAIRNLSGAAQYVGEGSRYALGCWQSELQLPVITLAA